MARTALIQKNNSIGQSPARASRPASSLKDLGLATRPNRKAATTDLVQTNGVLIGHRIFLGGASEVLIGKALRDMGEAPKGNFMFLRPTGLPGPLSELFDRQFDLVDAARSKYRLAKYSFEYALIVNEQGDLFGHLARNSLGDLIVMDRAIDQARVFQT